MVALRALGTIEQAGRTGQRQRDLFPPPLPAELMRDDEKWAALSRGCRRRILARHAQSELLREAIIAFNGLETGGDVSPARSSGAAHARQERAFERLAASCQRMGAPPPDVSTKDALSELQVSSPYDADHTGLRASLIVDRISLPAPGSQPVDLASSLLGRDGQQWIKEFVDSKFLPKQDAAAAKQQAGFRRPYNDPVLNSDVVYGSLIHKMIDSGVVDLMVIPLEAVQYVGVFAVRKKNDRQPGHRR